MKIYTQSEFDTLTVVGGFKWCPTGDYSRIKVFGAWCIFGARCRFGAGCSFGKWCRFGEGCGFGARCSFGDECHFGGWCWFDEGCRFGSRCSFGEGCRFGEWCRLENNTPDHWDRPYFAVDRIGPENHKAYFFRFGGVMHVRAGCFFGNETAFREKLARDASASKTRHYLAALELARDVLGDNE